MPIDELRAIDLLSRVPHGRVSASLRAMPYLALARHAVVDGRVLIRMHRGGGHHQALSGAVVAYAADNMTPAVADGIAAPDRTGHGLDDLWTAHVIGTCRLVRDGAAPAESALLGPLPHGVDDESYDPVYLWLTPEFGEAHRLRPLPPTAGRTPGPDAERVL
ncbi:pyridoxamine 5'-phosphate oxidase family protein [Streptomyces sp. NPDC060194]|uniref:pyridoxamine 5'-phosphate oxidase family protein n=1 Tax=Streptomyces sp. NPDC060194 TaxID=3347069 RepID=UPI0036560576